MRFMMIVKASKDSEAGIMPGEEFLGGRPCCTSRVVVPPLYSHNG